MICVFFILMLTNCSGQQSFFKPRSTIRQNKLNSLILKSMGHGRLREIDATSIINKSVMAKPRAGPPTWCTWALGRPHGPRGSSAGLFWQ